MLGGRWSELENIRIFHNLLLNHSLEEVSEKEIPNRERSKALDCDEMSTQILYNLLQVN